VLIDNLTQKALVIEDWKMLEEFSRNVTNDASEIGEMIEEWKLRDRRNGEWDWLCRLVASVNLSRRWSKKAVDVTKKKTREMSRHFSATRQ
jgi:uncharacterized protein (DUF2235 family)